MKRTTWFDGNVRPVRVGLYERECDGLQPSSARWDGAMWMVLVADRFGTTYQSIFQPGGERKFRWRGLTRPAT